MTRKERNAELGARIDAALKEHFPKLKAAQIAEICGCHVATVHKHAAALGWHFVRGTNASFRRYWHSDENERIVREGYAGEIPTCDIAKQAGISETAVRGIARRLGLRRSEEFIQKRLALGGKNHTSDRGKISASRAETIKKERRRMAYGLPLQTRLPLSDIPLKVRRGISDLVYRYGYFRDDRYPYTLFYDDDTQRLPETPVRKTGVRHSHCEQYFTQKYGIVFKAV